MVASMASFSPGDRVIRINDGAVGVVESVGPMGGLNVRWETGTMSVVVPSMLRPA